MSAEPDEELCRICQSNRAAHSELNHEFSTDGQLRPKKKVPPPRVVSQRVPDAMAARLAAILLERKLIDPGDFEFILTGRKDAPDARDDTDRSQRQAHS